MFHRRVQSTKKLQEMIHHQPHNMETVGYQSSMGKIAANDCAIGFAHVDANDPDTFPAL
jgi:hypothetical protein